MVMRFRRSPARALHAGGRRFESCTAHFARSNHPGLAQRCHAVRAISARCACACCPRCCPAWPASSPVEGEHTPARGRPVARPPRRRWQRVGPSRLLRYPVHWIAVAQVRDPQVVQRAQDERPSMGGEGQHVGNHASVGEDPRRVARRVDKGLVQPPAFAQVMHLSNKRGSHPASRARMWGTLSSFSIASS